MSSNRAIAITSIKTTSYSKHGNFVAVRIVGKLLSHCSPDNSHILNPKTKRFKNSLLRSGMVYATAHGTRSFG
ncbi:hypothetical protein [Pseudomonas koreensis]|uniref:Uncharacterized protein n=1 Tax=Pseudomonas koreensis TaxID=198620 RepID=A0A9X3B3Z1_9PSED|nr:hypothetical protein [Pseudomonas koreensis]MCU7249887.1 hypothetical protein [Pseudomonas koreensis]